MKNRLYLAFGLFAALSCGQQQKAQEETGLTQDIKPGCYAFRTEKDSALLHIESADSLVTGKLSYFIYEKDRNIGTFAGAVHGDTLAVTYTFQSEGTESQRQVVFLKSGDGWVEGSEANGLHFKETPCPAE
jgi:hypothetical protein